MGKIKITQTRSQIRRTEVQKKTLVALGLGKIDKSRVHEDNDVIKGMINQVQHLIKVEKA